MPSLINTLYSSELLLLKPLQTRRIYSACFYSRNGPLATQRAHSTYVVRRIPFWRDQLLERLRTGARRRLSGTVQNGTLQQPELLPCCVWGVLLIITTIVNPTGRGPLDEYDERVHSRQLRDDEHQRCMCRVLPIFFFFFFFCSSLN